MKRPILFAALLTLTACTAEPMSANPNPELHMPFTYGKWEATKDEGKCLVSSGYRGITIEKMGATTRMYSNESLSPGERLTLTVGNHSYETSDTYFTDSDVAPAIADLSHGDKAYLRLTTRGASNHGFRHIDQIVKSDGFKAAMVTCGDKPAKKVAKKKKAAAAPVKSMPLKKSVAPVSSPVTKKK